MTAESVGLLAEALDEAQAVVSGLSPTALTLPTPCPSWSTRDVLNHVVATTTKFSQFASGLTDSPHTPAGDLLGDEPLSVFERCRTSSAQAWRGADLRRRCRLPFGTFAASEAAEVNTFDVLVHTWDMAHAVGVPFAPSQQLITVSYAMAERLVTPAAVADGHYARVAARKGIPGAPSWHDVLVLTGRHVSL